MISIVNTNNNQRKDQHDRLFMSKKITEIPKFPARTHDAHKGRYGRVLIIGGSAGMIGAPALAANAALRSGAGLVRLAMPCGIGLTTAQLAPCATSVPLAQDNNGLISTDAILDILTALEDNDCVAIGPGMGCAAGPKRVVEQIISNYAGPLVIDADGLNNLATLDAVQLSPNTILTPHPGEMKRLWQAYFRDDLPADRCRQAESLSQKTGAVVVLKGAGTVVTDSQSTYINNTGNPGMATGGSGDVLTGCIAALMANKEAKLSALNAAILAVHIHGRAGDLASEKIGQTALIATDIIYYLPDAWLEIEH